MDPGLVTLAGGSALLLYSIAELSKIIQYLAGSQFRSWINKFAQQKVSGILVGAILALLLSSSGAVTVMLVSLASARILALEQVFAVSLGAAIGSTFIVHLFAFRISQYGMLIMAVGAVLEGLSANERSSRLCRGLMYLGMLFFSLSLVVDAGNQLQTNELFRYIVDYFRDRPLASLLISSILTALVHSSAATIAFVMSLALVGGFTLTEALPWVLGANLGTTATAFFASMKSGVLGKQAALGNFLVKLFGVVICYPFLEQLGPLCEKLAVHTGRQIAFSHTLFNVMLAVVFYPLIPIGVKVVRKYISEEEDKGPFSFQYIESRALQTPELALAQAQREILRVADIVDEMVDECVGVFRSRNAATIKEIREKDQVVDFLNKGVKLYLTRLTQSDMTTEQVQREFELLIRANDLESIGDIVDKNILELARKNIKKGYSFSAEGWAEIDNFHGKVVECLRLSTAYFASRDRALYTKLLFLFEEIEEMMLDLSELHVKRLHDGVKESLESSSIHLDLLGSLQRIAAVAVNFTRTEMRVMST